jgi:hypothetical protein
MTELTAIVTGLESEKACRAAAERAVLSNEAEASAIKAEKHVKKVEKSAQASRNPRSRRRRPQR